MLEETGFRHVCVFTAVRLVIIIGLIFCGGTGLAGVMTWRALVTGTISNHADDVLGDGFVGASKFSLLSGGYICVLGVRLVHEVVVDGDVAVFKTVGLGKDPCVNPTPRVPHTWSRLNLTPIVPQTWSRLNHRI